MTGRLVVVTGASGFIGAALAARLRESGGPLIGTPRSTPRSSVVACP